MSMHRGLVWAGAALLLIAACGPSAAPPSAGAPAAPSANQASSPATSGSAGSTASAPAADAPTPTAARSLTFALSAISPAVAPIWVGTEQGLFRRHGIDLELISMSPASTNQALAAGSVAFS